MNLQENISRIKQMMGVIKESRPAKETLDEFVDGKIGQETKEIME